MENTGNVRVVEINDGPKIDWRQKGNKLVFGDDDLTIRCDNRQKDWDVTVDICKDKEGDLVIGAGEGRFYVAQITIPGIVYKDEPVLPAVSEEDEDRSATATGDENVVPEDDIAAPEAEDADEPENVGKSAEDTPDSMTMETRRVAQPFDMSDVTLTLWSLDGFR